MIRSVLLALLALATLAAPARAQEVTGLAGWDLFLDPGHSGTDENVGIYGYSEPQKVLRIGLALREMLLTRTDIDTVYLSRTSDADQVSLSQRTDLANSLGADFFHSIHSNAGPSGTNNVLMLYGGWRRNGETVEKTPAGGGRMGEEFEDALSAAMRLPTIGNFADRTFYQGFPDNHGNQFPFLSVNRRSAMASVLSEGGFHTNPRQNQLNMNADWKRLEAQAHYWAILDWHGVPRSVHRIATGVVTDAESGDPVNGATVEIDGQTYTTDTFESLFNQYSSDPDQLANGFYYLEELGPGTHTVTVSAPGYETATTSVTMNDTEFTFADVSIVSTVPPVVVSSDPAEGDPSFPVTDALRLTLSRPLAAATVESAVTLTADGAPVAGAVSLEQGGYRLVFTPDAPLPARTAHTLTVAGTAATSNGSALDGDGDGTGGDAFVLSFTSSFPDTEAPRLVAAFPRPNAQEVEQRPLISGTFNEVIVPATLDGRVGLTDNATGEEIPGRFEHALAGDVGADPQARSVVSFVPDAPLAPGVLYRFTIDPGLEDPFGNVSESRSSYVFSTATQSPIVTVIDDFEGSSIEDNWWVPSQSGSTTLGTVVPDSTGRAASPRAALLGGETSMRIDYGWAEGSGPWLLREYLNSGPPFAVRFDNTHTVEARVFGDGNGTLFRFAVDDATSTEVSPWVAVDWYGWQTVSWDLSTGETGTWIGDGSIDGSLRFDSIQLSYDGAAPRFGELYIDDLRVTRPASVATDEAGPGRETLTIDPVRPTPFRDRAEVAFSLAEPATVTVRVFNAIGQQVAVLAERRLLTAGPHTLPWEANGLAAGVYVVRIEAGGATAAVQAVLAR